MFALSLLALLSAVAAVVPGDLFNLSTFTLQTPYPKGNGVLEVKYPALQTYSDKVFNATPCAENKGGCMQFWTPETGAHTGGSSFPRSELRQNIDWSTPSTGSSETHYSAATLKVLDAGAQNSVCIGQIHADGISGHCSIIVELEWTAGSIVAHVRDQACSNKNFVVGTAALGHSFSYNLSMVGDAVQVVTDTGSMAPYHYSVRMGGGGSSGGLQALSLAGHHLTLPPSPSHPLQWFAGKAAPQMYIKAGNYLQSSGTDSSVGSLVAFSSLHTYHSTQ
jgi:hypothetical protein